MLFTDVFSRICVIMYKVPPQNWIIFGQQILSLVFILQNNDDISSIVKNSTAPDKTAQLKMSCLVIHWPWRCGHNDNILTFSRQNAISKYMYMRFKCHMTNRIYHSCSSITGFINWLRKRNKMPTMPRILSPFPPTHLINSTRHEHSCQILCVKWLN